MTLPETHASLLYRARSGNEGAWHDLGALYKPFLHDWAQRHVDAHDADDLTQEIMLSVFRSLRRFEHNGRPGAFRTWLRLVAIHATYDFYAVAKRQPRGTGDSGVHAELHELEDPNSRLAQAWDNEHDLFVLNRLMEQVGAEFEPHTLAAFRRQTLDGAAADVVARELNMSIGAVYTAKSRVLQRMRELSDGLLDWDDE